MTDPDSPQSDAGAGTALTIADAARAARTDRHSIRRKMAAGAFPNAFKDAQGFWRIPETDLVAADLTLTGQPAGAPNASAASEPVATATATEREQAELLRQEIAELRHRVSNAEALLAAERRLSEELGRALQLARRTNDALLAQIGGERHESHEREPSPPPPKPRTNWQAGLRAARAREAELRAAREREAKQRAASGETGT